MINHRRLSSFLIILLSVFLHVQDQDSGQIAIVTGQVLDDHNKPVPGARISVLPQGATSGGLPGAITDRDGRYRFVSRPLGKVWLCAVKESAGYPDANYLLFAPVEDNRPEIVLAASSRLNVDIHLGPPNGVFEATVIDSTTKTIVSGARITMRRDQPLSDYSTTIPQSGHILFALPRVPIEISVTASGHRPWKYKDDSNGANSLTLGSSDHKVITIELLAEK